MTPLRFANPSPPSGWIRDLHPQTVERTAHNAGVWKGWKAIKPPFHPFHTPWKSLRGLPHYHGFGDGYHDQKTGKARRKPAIRATLTARGL
jgi:hypothetical protein